jgi:crooked neck
MPERLWKAYIDCEIAWEEHDRVRELYSRLLEKTKHVKVWMSYAQFEESLQNYSRMREIFDESDRYFKENPDLKEVVYIYYTFNFCRKELCF